MGVIAFSRSPKETWAAAGWAIRQILDDVASQYPGDSEFAMEFERAKAVDGLIVYLLRPDLAARMTDAIREVTTGILATSIRSSIVDQRYGNGRTVVEYNKGLRQLLEAIPSPPTAPDAN